MSETVMAQLEHPDNLARWDDPAHRLVTLVLMRCGLRISDATRLPLDCVTRDGDGAPYLRYFNHKMKREALVPIDDKLERDLREQHGRVRDRWPDGTPVLFPRPTDNPAGQRPLRDATYRRALGRWLTPDGEQLAEVPPPQQPPEIARVLHSLSLRGDPRPWFSTGRRPCYVRA